MRTREEEEGEGRRGREMRDEKDDRREDETAEQISYQAGCHVSVRIRVREIVLMSSGWVSE